MARARNAAGVTAGVTVAEESPTLSTAPPRRSFAPRLPPLPPLPLAPPAGGRVTKEKLPDGPAAPPPPLDERLQERQQAYLRQWEQYECAHADQPAEERDQVRARLKREIVGD